MFVPAYPRILECLLLYMPNCNVIYDVVDKDDKVRYPFENISCFLPGMWSDQGLIDHLEYKMLFPFIWIS